MKKLHKQNLIITWCSVLALSMVSVLGFGLSVMALKGSIVVIVCGIISTIGYFLPLPDDKKILMDFLKTSATVRASTYFYNDEEDIKRLVGACKNGGNFLDAYFI